MSDDTFAVTCVIHDLGETDVALRRKAARMISAAGKAIGGQRCAVELMPYIEAVLEDSDDEVLESLARELGHFYDVMGPGYVSALFGPLATLCGSEEAKVREAAVVSASNVLQRCLANGGGHDGIYSQAMTFAKDLAASRWAAQRSSAVGLLPTLLNFLYAKAGPAAEAETAGVWALYNNNVSYQDPMVRRAVCSTLPFVEVRGLPEAERHVLRLLSVCVKDCNDGVRIIAVGVLAKVALNAMPTSHSLLLECVAVMRRDDSWRVKYALASELSLLGTAFGPAVCQTVVVDLLLEQFNDTEKEIRQACAGQLAGLASQLTPTDIVRAIIPCCAQYVHDSSEHVRSALAAGIVRVATRLPSEQSQQEALPIIVDLLGDDSCDVRLAVLHDAGDLTAVVRAEVFTKTLVRAITGLCKDPKWRARQKTLCEMERLAPMVGPAFFDTHMLPLLIEALSDKVYAVRTEAIETLEKVSKTYGNGWVDTNVLPRVLPLTSHTNYLNRTASMYCLERMVRTLPPLAVSSQIVPCLCRALRDNVPNVRFVSLRVLHNLLQRAATASLVRENDAVRETVGRLESDTDPEVRFHLHEVALLLQV